jgi:signal transduction histidine kinase
MNRACCGRSRIAEQCGREPNQAGGWPKGTGWGMQLMEHAAELSGLERMQMDAVVETPVDQGFRVESLAEVAHDARNMVTALGLYCELLEEPGVLTPSFQHYGSELRLVSAASRRLVEKLVALEVRTRPGALVPSRSARESGSLSWMESIPVPQQPPKHWDLLPATPIDNLAEELVGAQNLLTALAGPSIALTIHASGGELPVRLTGEELTRILVNLIKNSTEAMPAGGRIQLDLREGVAEAASDPWLVLTVEDNGPGLPLNALERVFDPGFTTRSRPSAANGKDGLAGAHRGLGLSIARSLVESAGGRINAANRDPSGACFQIELPARKC